MDETGGGEQHDARLGLIMAFDVALRASMTATATLERWCREHGLGNSGRVRAELVEHGPDEATIERREQLRMRVGEALRHRRVRLCCGDLVLSLAQSWYVPSRLSLAMNAALDHGDEPLGRVVEALSPWRMPLASKLLPPSGDIGGPVLEHRALLLAGSGLPLAEVREVYLSGLLPRVP